MEGSPQIFIIRKEFTPSDRTGEGPGWEQIKRWRKQCRALHRNCAASTPQDARPNGGKWLPTRLLDTENEENLKIVQTADFSDSARQATSYLVLSHCWGTKLFTTLNLGSELQLKRGFKTSELPQNFKDAVRATRELGFQYIWIDSLCMIQGKGGDWESESLLMDKVYMNADICLAASAARDAFGGFLDKARNLAEFQPISIDPTPASSNSTGLFAYPHLPDTALRLWDQEVEQSPLNRRGWVLQERVLSPRTVHFTSEQLCWECQELQALEMIPNVELSGHSSKECELGRSENTAFSTRDFDTYGKWRGIVEAYTKCDPLTEESDKLVAISGLANVFAKRLGSKYYAGLWAKNLPFDLLWDLGPKGQRRRPENYRAPTWSWASFDGKITWNTLLNQPADGWVPFIETRSVHIQTEARSEDAIGQVKPGAELKIFGYLVPKDRLNLTETWRFAYRRDEPDSFNMDKDPSFLLPLVQRLDLHNRERGSQFRGLILGRVTHQDMESNGEAIYRRLGIFEMDDDHAKLGDLHEWLGHKETEVRII